MLNNGAVVGCREAVMDRDDPMAGIAEIEAALEAHADAFLVLRGIELAHRLAESGDRCLLHAEEDAEAGAEPLHHRLDLPPPEDVVEARVEAVGDAIEPRIEIRLADL